MQEVGHRAMDATLAQLRGYRARPRTKEDSRTLIHQCFDGVDIRNREFVPRLLVNTVHVTAKGEVVHFDFTYLGDSEVTQGIGELDGYVYVLVPLEVVRGYLRLARARTCCLFYSQATRGVMRSIRGAELMYERQRGLPLEPGHLAGGRAGPGSTLVWCGIFG